MRHGTHNHSFSRRTGPKMALFKGLIVSMVEHERIHTTLAKAKEIRRHVEKAITLGKDGSLNSRRVLISRIGNSSTVHKIMTDLSVRFKSRPGGYTRIVKTVPRPGDQAKMALLEFVDYKVKAAGETTVKGDAGAVARAKANAKARAAHKKSVRKLKAASRKENR